MPVFLGVRDHADVFSSVVAQRFMDMTLATDSGPERVTGIAVSEGWTRTLGLRPLLGRAFLPEEERRGLGSGVALVSHAAWRGRFGGDPEIVGRAVSLDGQSRTIVGVMPEGLRYPYEASFWLPMSVADDASAQWGLNIQARLRDSASLGAMHEQLARLSETLPALNESGDMALLAVPLREVLVDDDGRLLVALLAAVGFLMLIVCVNVAHLLLAGALARHREFAIRTALGAGLARQLRQLVVEGCLLALLGGALGLGFAYAASSLLDVLLPASLKLVLDGLPFDARVVGFGVALSLLAGLAFGVLPALRLAAREPRQVLHGGERATGASGARFGGALIVSELSLSLVLLCGAGALLVDLDRRQRLDLGYQAEGLLTLNVALGSPPYLEPERRLAFLDEALGRLRAVPGVESAGALNLFPAEGQGTYLTSLEAEGQPAVREEPFLAHTRLVSDAAFETMRLRVRQGRAIEAGDAPQAPRVAVVSRSLAERFWPGQDPVGRRLRNARRGAEADWLQVVGVVGDVHEFYGEVQAALYLPFAQAAGDRSAGHAVFVVRAAAAPSAIVPHLRQAIWSVDPTMAVFDVASAEALYRDSLGARRSAGLLTTLFAFVGLLVAVVGVYGAVAFAVSRRTREIAIRLAIGADRSRVLGELVAQAARPLLAGLALGAAGVVALSRLMASVTEVDALDPRLVGGAALVLGVVALLACYLPARRAAALDPATALRGD